MKKHLKVIMTAVTLSGMAAYLAHAEPGAADTQTPDASATQVSTSAVNSAEANPAWPAETPKALTLKWTEFRGKVTRVDLQNKILQIREGTTDTLIEIPVSRNVSIYKHGRHEYALGDVKEGETVTVRNNEAS